MEASLAQRLALKLILCHISLMIEGLGKYMEMKLSNKII